MPETRRPSLSVLIVITMVGQLALNIILPSLAGLTEVFDATYAQVTLTLSLFLLGMAAGQLIYGTLSDRFGRRPVVLAGLALFNVGTILCLIAPTIEVLILGRVVQAVGGSAGMVMGRAMVRDIYDTNRAAAMIAYLTMAVVVVPTLSPLIGGYLDVWYGWWANFVFVLAAGILALAAAFGGAHETLIIGHRHQINFAALFRSYVLLLRNPLFNGYAFQVSFNTAAYFSFLAGSPRVVIDFMGGTPEELGIYLVVVTTFYILGNFGTAKLSSSLGVPKLVTIGTLVALIGAVGLIGVQLTHGITPLSFIGLMSLVALGNGFCISAGLAGSISADPQRVGAASGLAGAMQLGLSAAGTFWVGLILLQTALPMVSLIAIFTFLSAVAAPLGRLYAKQQVF